MACGNRKYSCNTAGETLEWIQAIVEFIKPYRFFLDAHVVNFFKDKLWEAVDKDWMDCLQNEPVGNLLQIPSGVVQDHWPLTLKDFIRGLRSLSLPREQVDLHKAFPGIHITSLSNVLSLGMNHKKKHEIESLAAIVSSLARVVGVDTIVDVGSGQGYLAQVLSFVYQLSVIAVDACSHHGKVTDARAARIKKHYAAKNRKTRAEEIGLRGPRTITCRVLSPLALKSLNNQLLIADDSEDTYMIRENSSEQPQDKQNGNVIHLSSNRNGKSSMVLAGLHACGDLSVTMLRTFLESNEVKAVVSIGCCYNLLSEEANEENNIQCGFPMSKGVKSTALSLGKSARDLACQSAERWTSLDKTEGLQNFELHAFRAAFQMVLLRNYPDVLTRSPAIGRQGKALRRQHQRRIRESNMIRGNTANIFESSPHNSRKNVVGRPQSASSGCETIEEKDSSLEADAFLHEQASDQSFKNEQTGSADRYSLLVKFCESGLDRLGLLHQPDFDISELWKEIEQFTDLIGPYWSLRAAMGPVLETIIILDRLLFLQEHGNSLDAVISPIFDPILSPRNVAVIARKI